MYDIPYQIKPIHVNECNNARQIVPLLHHAAAPERHLQRPDDTRGTGAAAEPIGGSGGAAHESGAGHT